MILCVLMIDIVDWNRQWESDAGKNECVIDQWIVWRDAIMDMEK